MKVEIGALVEKEYGQLVKDEISQVKGVEYVFLQQGAQTIYLTKNNSGASVKHPLLR